MGATLAIILVISVITYLEIKALKKKKQHKEITIFFVLLIISSALAIALALQVELPNPLDFLTFIYEPFSHYIFQLLK